LKNLCRRETEKLCRRDIEKLCRRDFEKLCRREIENLCRRDIEKLGFVADVFSHKSTDRILEGRARSGQTKIVKKGESFPWEGFASRSSVDNAKHRIHVVLVVLDSRDVHVNPFSDPQVRDALRGARHPDIRVLFALTKIDNYFQDHGMKETVESLEKAEGRLTKVVRGDVGPQYSCVAIKACADDGAKTGRSRVNLFSHFTLMRLGMKLGALYSASAGRRTVAALLRGSGDDNSRGDDNNSDGGDVAPDPIVRARFAGMPNSTLTTLDVSHNDLGRADAPMLRLLEGSLLEIPTVTELNLSNNKLGRVGPLRWWWGWSRIQSLATLDLSHNELGHVSSSLLCALGRNARKIPTLTTLNLSHNDLGRGPSWFFEQMHFPPGLMTLDLSHNKLGGGSLWFFEEMRFLPGLTMLDLSHNDLGHGPSWVLARIRGPKLTTLDLSHNDVGRGPWDEMRCPSLTTLNLSHNDLGGRHPWFLEEMRCPSLTTPNLSHNDLGGRRPWFLEEMRFLPCLTMLDLSHNDLGGQHPWFLEEMCFPPGLTTLDLSHNDLGGSPWLLEEIQFPPGLTTLDLSHNKLGGGSLWFLKMRCPNLTTLNLSHNKIDRSSAGSLSRALPRLTSLGLSHTSLAESFEDLIKTLDSPTTSHSPDHSSTFFALAFSHKGASVQVAKMFKRKDRFTPQPGMFLYCGDDDDTGTFEWTLMSSASFDHFRRIVAVAPPFVVGLLADGEAGSPAGFRFSPRHAQHLFKDLIRAPRSVFPGLYWARLRGPMNSQWLAELARRQVVIVNSCEPDLVVVRVRKPLDFVPVYFATLEEIPKRPTVVRVEVRDLDNPPVRGVFEATVRDGADQKELEKLLEDRGVELCGPSLERQSRFRVVQGEDKDTAMLWSLATDPPVHLESLRRLPPECESIEARGVDGPRAHSPSEGTAEPPRSPPAANSVDKATPARRAPSLTQAVEFLSCCVSAAERCEFADTAPLDDAKILPVKVALEMTGLLLNLPPTFLELKERTSALSKSDDNTRSFSQTLGSIDVFGTRVTLEYMEQARVSQREHCRPLVPAVVPGTASVGEKPGGPGGWGGKGCETLLFRDSCR
jgi:Leucine-rich repeat (LRR) protein